jgi:hypothetical protein
MARNKIFRGDVTVNRPVQDEAVTSEAIAPGSLVAKTSGTFSLHGTDGAGAGVKLYVADLNTLLQGDTSDSWASGDTAVCFEPRPGERYNMLVAASQNITALDTPLASNGDGTLRIGVVGTDDILCYADEVVNATSSQLVNVKF